jgi:mRNA interferase MazF
MIRRGSIYLARLGKRHGSEMGKTRPVLVVQNNVINMVLERMAYKGVVVMPLTTQLVGGDLRLKIPARDQLRETSEVCVSEIYTIDLSRFVNTEETLTALTEDEMREVEEKAAFVLGIKSYLDFLS